MPIAAAFWLTGVNAVAGTYSFNTINNPGDLNFNQLLGINNAGVIAGYFGDGATVPNNGYTWTKSSGFTAENFAGAAQTQVIGINNTLTGGSYGTDGFYVDSAGANHGFTQIGGVQTTVDNPATSSIPALNQLLGLNDSSIAAGFYQDSAGQFHGYQVNLTSKAFTAVTLPSSFNAVSVTASGVNNNGWVSGFYTDTAGNTHGFIDAGGTFTSLDDPNGNGTNTSFLGLNNDGQVVGAFTDANGTNGLVYDIATHTWQTVNDPNQSFTSAFGVSGTFINGINDRGDLVGFYSDGTHVNGLLATATPEPASFGLLLAGAALALGAGLKRRKRLS